MLLAALLAPACIVRAEAEGEAAAWKTYTNARFGFRLLHPPELMASRPPDNGDGREFHTRDKEFSVAAFAHFMQEGESLETLWKRELEELDATVTYKRKGDGWFVLSGVRDGTEYYRKTFVKKGNFASFHITYPHARAAKYDPWVERIAKGFVPFPEGDYDRIAE